MKKFTIEQCLEQKKYFVDQMLQDKIFIYPTDSLYGIGGLFTHENIEKIAHIKHREISKKMNIIAPSWEWIFENFIVHNPDFLLECFNMYHATTFILEPKNSSIALYKNNDNTIGVRIIKHPFQELITELGKPFISTSANVAGGENIKTLANLDTDIVTKTDFVIDGYIVTGIPSVLVFDKTKEILKRD